jgi:hypothetical protein
MLQRATAGSFLKAIWNSPWTAADFFKVEVWTRKGLQRFMVLFFIELLSCQLYSMMVFLFSQS